MLLDTADNARPELSVKCWPNLRIVNMKVIAPALVGTVNLYELTGKLSELKKPVEYINKVNVSGLEMVRPNGKPAKLNVRLSTKEFKTVKELEYILIPLM